MCCGVTICFVKMLIKTYTSMDIFTFLLPPPRPRPHILSPGGNMANVLLKAGPGEGRETLLLPGVLG